MPYKGLKQMVRYAAVSLIASFGVDMAETIGWTKRSKRTVSATETAINSVTGFPISCAAPFRSPAPTACPMLTVVPIARPTIMTVSMCITCEPAETAVVLARPQTILINSATVAKSRGGKKFFSCGHPQVLLSPPRAARKVLPLNICKKLSAMPIMPPPPTFTPTLTRKR